MVSGIYKLVFTNIALKDAKKIQQAGLKAKVESLLKIIADDPFCDYPRYEKLIGNFRGFYSRRINIQHRIVYQVCEKEFIIKIIRMWTQ